MSETISIAKFKELNKAGRVGKSAKGSKAKEEMWSILCWCGEYVVQEHKFSEERKFKFDFALPKEKIAIEYEGLGLRTDKSGGVDKSGHTSPTGYTSNCEKYNLATVLGWKLLRYTALNYKDLERDLKLLLNK
jgi:hypothetical protein